MLRNVAICASLAILAACAGEPGDEGEMQGTAVDTTAQTPPATEALQPATATAELLDAQGQSVGTATLEEGESGVRIIAHFTGLPEGEHGFHIHETGQCTAPEFTSAGGHFNPTNKQHGLQNPQGPHAGDLENIQVGADSTGSFTADNDRITLSDGPTSLFDADGSALVVHQGPDDAMTDPSGDSGARIACGVITRG
jgi:Cu-Zn family superoxide dismutase